jgi:hypothetical protein
MLKLCKETKDKALQYCYCSCSISVLDNCTKSTHLVNQRLKGTNMPSLHRAMRFTGSLCSLFKKESPYSTLLMELKPQPPCHQEKYLPLTPEELKQWRKEFQKLTIRLYLNKPRRLSELNKVATMAFSKMEWVL